MTTDNTFGISSIYRFGTDKSNVIKFLPGKFILSIIIFFMVCMNENTSLLFYAFNDLFLVKIVVQRL